MFYIINDLIQKNRTRISYAELFEINEVDCLCCPISAPESLHDERVSLAENGSRSLLDLLDAQPDGHKDQLDMVQY